MKRFKKGQKVWQLIGQSSFNGGFRIIGIRPVEIEACGKKIIKLKGSQRKYYLTEGESLFGPLSHLIEQFYSTPEQAHKAKEEFNNTYNA